MMQNSYIVCYDIADPRRLQRVHSFIANEAEFLQRSVYHLSVKKESLADFVSALDELICDTEDDVRIYPLPTRAKLEIWGKEHCLAGVYLLG